MPVKKGNKGNLGRKKIENSENSTRSRINVGARIDAKLWDKFRIFCINMHMSPGQALDEAIKLIMTK